MLGPSQSVLCYAIIGTHAVAWLHLLLTVDSNATIVECKMHAIPSWLSVLPPLLTLVVAIVFRQVLIALFLGSNFERTRCGAAWKCVCVCVCVCEERGRGGRERERE